MLAVLVIILLYVSVSNQHVSQLKLTQAKQVARYGLGNGEVNGLIKGVEKTVLNLVWGKEKYWEAPVYIILTVDSNIYVCTLVCVHSNFIFNFHRELYDFNCIT